MPNEQISGFNIPGYKIIRQIGTGSTCEVFQGISLLSDYPVAIKIIPISNEEKRQKVISEIVINQSLEHPHIIRCIDYFNFDKYVAIVTEFAANGCLFSYFSHYMSTNPDAGLIMNNQTVQKIFTQVVKAVGYLHNVEKVAHRDLKPENILLTDKFDAKLSDFGLSKKCEPEENMLMQTRCGSPHYVAPEIITAETCRRKAVAGMTYQICEKKCYDEKADVWSLGVILYLLSTGHLPFSDSNLDKLFHKIVEEPLRFNEKSLKTIPIQLQELIGHMLEKDPSNRYSIEDVLKHEFFAEKNKCRATKSLINVQKEIILKTLATPTINVRSSFRHTMKGPRAQSPYQTRFRSTCMPHNTFQ